MLLWFSGLVAFDVVDHVVLPLRRGRLDFVADLIEHIVEIIDGVNDFTNVGLLRLQHCGRLTRRLYRVAVSGIRRIAVDTVYIVLRIVRMIFPGIRAVVPRPRLHPSKSITSTYIPFCPASMTRARSRSK